MYCDEGNIEPQHAAAASCRKKAGQSGCMPNTTRLHAALPNPTAACCIRETSSTGPYLPVGKDGQKKQTYLAAWIDDATRFVVGARFCNQKVDIIEDTLREAILTYGKPEAIYVDNGKQYRSNWLQTACAKLGIKLLHAKPYHPEGKGKIEAFNRRLILFSQKLLCKSRAVWRN